MKTKYEEEEEEKEEEDKTEAHTMWQGVRFNHWGNTAFHNSSGKLSAVNNSTIELLEGEHRS